MQADERIWVRLVLSGPFATAYANFNLSDGTLGTVTGLDSTPTATLEDGHYICKMTATTNAASAATIQCQLATGNNTISYTGDGSSGINFAWAQFELGSAATAIQTVTSQYNVTEIGVPSVHYLKFDGVDDAMVTPSIDFSASDEMSVFAGVRKLGTSVAILIELSTDAAGGTASAGAFYITAPELTNRYRFLTDGGVGSIADVTSADFDTPVTSVVTGISQQSAPFTVIRADGVQYGTSATDPGVTSYGNYPLYIGARNQTSLYYNGNLYGLTVRGALSDAGEIADAEAITAELTGITL